MPFKKTKPPEPTLYLEVHAGLCNRLRALVSGICLAEDLKKHLVVYWSSSKNECKAGFYDLYQHSLPPWVTIIDGFPPHKTVECRSELEARIAAGKGKIIRSLTPFHSNANRRRLQLRRLLPKQFLLRQVCQNLQKLPKGLAPIGIHIRRTDCRKAIQQSPISAFESAMHAIPEGFFYVASDDPASVQYLSIKFPGRVYCHENIRRRDSLEGMREALVSLYTLALCSRILGSYYSSFSITAGDLRIATIETIRKNS